MDCGIPFCNNGCPLGNLIPDWNDLVYRDHWRDAIERLHATNNFPEFTGRLCPAPCEAACVLGINQDPVTIKQVEVEIVDRAWDEGWIDAGRRRRCRPASGSPSSAPGPPGSPPRSSSPAPATTSSCSSGPTASAGCCATASPSSRWRSATSTAASTQMRGRGHRVPRRTSNVGVDVTVDELRARVRRHRARRRRDRVARPARSPAASSAASTRRWSTCRWRNRVQQGDLDEPPITAEGKRVVIIGGGDTGADCLGTAHRQGAASVHQFEILPRPPDDARARPTRGPRGRTSSASSSAHEEGGERVYSVNTECFLGDDDGNVRALRAHEVEMVDGQFEKVEGTDFELPCELVLLAMGFLGPQREGLLEQLGVELDARGNVARDADVHDQRARRVRVRRHGPGPEPHRVGDRRGPLVRGRGRHLADGGDAPPRADRALHAAAALGRGPSCPALGATTTSHRGRSTRRSRTGSVTTGVARWFSRRWSEREHRAGVEAEDPGDRLRERAGAHVLVVAHGAVVGGDQRGVRGGRELGQGVGDRRRATKRCRAESVRDQAGALRLDRLAAVDLGAGVAVAQRRGPSVERGVQVLRHVAVGPPAASNALERAGRGSGSAASNWSGARSGFHAVSTCGRGRRRASAAG